MHIFTHTAALSAHLRDLQSKGQRIGFVPTMGALHEGHVSLVDEALGGSDVVVCSLFVNPSQFNDAEDLLKYPRPHDEDLRMLMEAGCHVAFLPPVSEVYPPGLKTKVEVDMKGLDDRLEGEFRPGHFDGMLEVVHRLLQITQPDHIYMGQKDFQQLLLVKHMIDQLDLPVQLVSCPIHREEDGLAMSSRNRRLSPKARAQAPALQQALQHVKAHWADHPEQAIADASAMVTASGLRLEYLTVAHQDDLTALSAAAEGVPAIALAAAWCDDIRLIDNVLLD